MSAIRLTLLLATLTAWLQTTAQVDSIAAITAKADSVLYKLQELPKKYLTDIDNKIDKYTSRVTNKTEKTLTKLAKWEVKIKSLLEKASPETAQRLFSNNQLTFATALEKYKQGQSIVTNQRKKYNEYRDKLTTSIKYLEEQKEKLDTKLVQPLAKVKEKIGEYETAQDETDAMEQFIKERKKQLIDQGLQYLGKSKYFQKINKETYYYVETIKNYKQIFSDKQKAEETALTLLNKIPAFSKFVEENSMLASLFRRQRGVSTQGNTISNLVGLQRSSSVQALIRERIAAGGPNAQQQVMQNLQQARSELGKLKDKLLKAGATSSDTELPNFKPNTQKTKTFLQRIEFGNDISISKNNKLLPGTANIALSAAYKFSDTKQLGLGIAYKAGLGNLQHIKLTHEGIQLRSFGEMKLKKGFWFTGGWELIQNAGFKNFEQLKGYELWQQSALIGIEKKLRINTKWFKASKISLLWDALSKNHTPVSQSFQIRFGYNFK